MQTFEIKTFELKDLVERTIKIQSFRNNNTELIMAFDLETGETFVLKEIKHAVADEDTK